MTIITITTITTSTPCFFLRIPPTPFSFPSSSISLYNHHHYNHTATIIIPTPNTLLSTPPPPSSFKLSPDGRLIATAGTGHLLKLWDYNNNLQMVCTGVGHSDTVRRRRTRRWWWWWWWRWWE